MKQKLWHNYRKDNTAGINQLQNNNLKYKIKVSRQNYESFAKIGKQLHQFSDTGLTCLIAMYVCKSVTSESILDLLSSVKRKCHINKYYSNII